MRLVVEAGGVVVIGAASQGGCCLAASAVAIGTIVPRTPGCQTVTSLRTRTRIATTIMAAAVPRLSPTTILLVNEKDKKYLPKNNFQRKPLSRSVYGGKRQAI